MIDSTKGRESADGRPSSFIPSSSSGQALHPSSLIIAVIGAIIALAWVPIRMHMPFDDTYITFRYAQNLAHGFGIVWNPGSSAMPPGPHTEGYTNFLYVLLLTPFSAMGSDLVIVAQCINVIAVIVSAIAIWKITNYELRITNGDDLHPSSFILHPFPCILAVSLFYLDPYIWFNAFSGMETSLFTMWLLLAVASVGAFGERPLDGTVGQGERRTPLRGMLPFIFATLAALTRPEGAMMGPILLVAAAFKLRGNGASPEKRNLKAAATSFAIAFVLPLALYACWKYWYFGNLLPNSFYVKVAQAGTVLPGRGTLRIFYTGIWYLPLLAVFALKRRKKSPVVQAAVLWCVALSAFYLFSQLIQPQYERFTNSIEAMLIVGVGIGYRGSSIGGTIPARNPVLGTRYPIFLIMLLAFHILWSLYVRGGLGYITRETSYEDRYRRMADIFRSIPHHEEITIATPDAGILPYYSGLRHIDPVGLNTNEIAHSRSASEIIRFILHSKPEIIVIPLAIPAPPHDSCRCIILGADGLIGPSYPAFAAAVIASTYKPIVLIPQAVYDLNVLADTTSPHYRDIVNTLVPRIGRDPDFREAVRCMR